MLKTLLGRCLPDDRVLEEVAAGASEAIWTDAPQLALYLSLKNCQYLDWDKYLLYNLDVAKVAISPLIHFTMYGIYEGRKLYLIDEVNNDIGKIQDAANAAKPKVSLIICNYNNELYLEKCLDSAQKQTLCDIEIIIVDDCSTDASCDIIEKYAAHDSRFRLIQHDVNKSQHMARKIGVHNSNGSYIMFLDSDDFLATQACEKAYNAISKGEDIIVFNTNIIVNNNVLQQDITYMMDLLNKDVSISLVGNNIIEWAYKLEKMNYTIWNKIYKSSICKRAFAEMEDGYFPSGQDYYEFFVISSFSNKLRSITDKLIFYNYGGGFSRRNRTPAQIKRLFYLGDLYNPMIRYAKKSGFGYLKQYIEGHLVSGELLAWINEATDDLSEILLERMAKQFTIPALVTYAMITYAKNWKKFAKRLHGNGSPCNVPEDANKIGIFYHRMTCGGVESVIRTQAAQLLDKGYTITYFLEEKTEDDIYIDPRVKIYYISTSLLEPGKHKKHINEFYTALVDAQIDCLIYHNTQSPALLWIIFMCKLMRIPIIVYNHSEFLFNYIDTAKQYNISHQNSVLLCADKIVCLSSMSETYFRNIGIDAEYIPNPVAIHSSRSNRAKHGFNILFMARLSDAIKHVEQALYVLQTIRKTEPTAHMYFVGDFVYGILRSEFNNLVNKLDLYDSITLTGIVHDPSDLFEKCQYFLSTSYYESFGLSIVEALAHGLPCVSYEVANMPSLDNDAIITVPQGDYCAASQELINLHRDSERYATLSKLALVQSQKYDVEKYTDMLVNAIHSIGKFSKTRAFNAADYRRIYHWIAHYYGNNIYKWTNP